MLKQIKVLLNIQDISRDSLLDTLINLKSRKLNAALEVAKTPEALEYIVVELVINHYGRLGSEGLASESVEGISRTYIDTVNELEPYAAEIRKFLNSSTGKFKVF